MNKSAPLSLAAPQQTAAERSSLFTGAGAGLAMIGIGALAFFSPLVAGVSLGYLITAGLGVWGVAPIVGYFKTQANRRDGGALASGLTLSVLSLFALWASLGTPLGLAGLLTGLAVAAAFFSMLQGLGGFIAFSQLQDDRAEGGGWMLAGGVLNLLLGLSILAAPLAGWFAISTVWGIYLGVSGIALIAQTLAAHFGRKRGQATPPRWGRARFR